MDSKSWPETFYCPLTRNLMKDPVMDSEGNTYEKIAIVTWLKDNSTSPITRNPLRAQDLVPNRALKDTIALIINSKASSSSLNLKPKQQASNQDIYIEESKNEVDQSGLGVHLDVDIVGKNGNTLVSIKPNDKLPAITRTPSTVCCVIDISGSMGDEAKIQTQDYGKEGFGLSILDLVKHAVRTIINSLGDSDSLALVTFNKQAQVAVELTKMNEAGKKEVKQVLERMKPKGSTNIWDGLYQGLEVLRKKADGKNSAIFLLTDGRPNVIPPGGHLPMLQKYKNDYSLPNIINTFGFGYTLDSKLLYDSAVKGNGAYAFIPDGTFVGTIFMNALSNLLSTVATDVCLSIQLDQARNADYSLIKHYNHQVFSWGLQIQLGSVMFGQTKNFVIPMSIDPSKKLNLTLKYNTPYKNRPVSVNQQIQVRNTDDPEIHIHKFRLMFINEVTRATELAGTKPNEALSIVKDLAKQIKESKVASVKIMKDIVEDIEGQTVMAITSHEHFQRWGRHFLPSLARAHLLQQCNNFKDPGVQNYGGQIFNKLRDKIDDVFVKAPAPKPSIIKAEPPPPLDNMAVFYDCYGGCIADDCIVSMADGTTKLIKHIKKDDQVLGANGESAKVVCVVKTMCEKNRVRLVEFESGLKITAWHPIKLGGKFFFPCTVEEPFRYEYTDCPAVYNFVLESHHLMVVNGVECVTLGHGFQEDVVKHEYYGTSAVVQDLRAIEGWDEGLVVLASGDVRRDVNTGMVAGIIKAKDQSEAASGSVELAV